MRSMANNIAATLLFFALALPGAAHAMWTDWENVMSEIVEPPRSMETGWTVNEIPANIIIYYDVDGDETPDIAFAHPIMATSIGVYCEAVRIPSDFYWVFTTCPAEHATDYYVAKQWALYKFAGGGWQRIYQYVDEHGRPGTCSVQSSESIPWDSDEERAGAGCPKDGRTRDRGNN